MKEFLVEVDIVTTILVEVPASNDVNALTVAETTAREVVHECNKESGGRLFEQVEVRARSCNEIKDESWRDI